MTRAPETRPHDEAVRAGVLASKTMAKIADECGLSRNQVAGIVFRLRQRGVLPPADKRETGRSARLVQQIAAKKEPHGYGLAAQSIHIAAEGRQRAKNEQHLRPGNIMGKALSRPSDPGILRKPAQAYDPLPGVEPVTFLKNVGCRWPVDGLLGSGLMVCGQEREGPSYCGFHHRLSTNPRVKTGGAPAERH